MLRCIALASLIGLVACVSDNGPSEPFAFVGSWQCGSKVFAFTNTTWDNGTDRYPISSVSREGSNYTLRFANGYIMALAAVTETGLTWVSGQSGDQVNCRRL
jgi:hypothetical protein